MPHGILIADPHEGIRRRIRELLEEAGWQVIGEATTGQEAIDKVKKLAPDLVTLDLRMPVKNGLEAAAEIQKHSPATKVLIFTIHADEEIKKEALRAGVNGYALKSAPATNLIAEVKKILGEQA